MLFALGYIAGLVTAGIIIATLVFFRAGIEKHVKIIETKIAQAGPRPTGAIFLPDDDATAARKAHVAENNRKGLDTPISELQ